MACEYCGEQTLHLLFANWGFEGFIEAQVFEGKLYVSADSPLDDSYRSEHVDINFCPMCGRELRRSEGDGR